MKKEGKCLFCDKSFTYDDTRQFGKYCNNTCQQDHKFYTETKLLVEQGKISQRPTLKNYLIRVKEEKCELCNQNSFWKGNPLSLQVDHVDGNSDNNFPINLRLLCPNCHSQQETSKNRNKKNCKRNVYLRSYKRKNLVRN